MPNAFSERSPYYPNADEIPTNPAEEQAHEDSQAEQEESSNEEE